MSRTEPDDSSKMERKLTQHELEDLSAFFDGELDAARAAEINRLTQTDPAWRLELQRLTELDLLLDAYTAPAPPAELPARIVAASRRPVKVVLLRRWISAAAAAAAAVVLALAAALAPQRAPNVTQQTASADNNEVERLVEDNLDFFKSYEVVANFETLRAIEDLEQEETYQ